MNVVLGVGGGIAAYKAAELARALMQRGARVQVVMTAGAQEFIRRSPSPPSPAARSSPTCSRPAVPEATLSSAIEHIGVAQENEMLVVAPATADLLAKFAHGLADDFLTTTVSGVHRTGGAGAGHEHQHVGAPATQANLETLRRRGHLIVEPEDGIAGLRHGRSGPAGRAASRSPRRWQPRSVGGAIWKARRS